MLGRSGMLRDSAIRVDACERGSSVLRNTGASKGWRCSSPASQIRGDVYGFRKRDDRRFNVAHTAQRRIGAGIHSMYPVLLHNDERCYSPDASLPTARHSAASASFSATIRRFVPAESTGSVM